MWQTYDHQDDVIDLLDSGKILYGPTGSGKSRAALAYYVKKEFNFRRWRELDEWKHIFVITTAKKRDSLDWEREAALFGIGTEEHATIGGIIQVDSWNNISKYTDITNAFFIFDEQRLVGSGAWVKSFYKITDPKKNNRWLLLSGTPGDRWLDYGPVFVANGFYRNISEFKRLHVIYEAFRGYPKVKGYLNEEKLELLRNEVLVEMPFDKHTTRNLNYIEADYDKEAMRRIMKDRWNIYTNEPIKDAGEMFRLMRRLVNLDPSRMDNLRFLLKAHPRLIVFYNFDSELELLRTLRDEGYKVYEYNGHRHDPVPTSDNWVYLVQYQAGAEAWNCTETDAMVLYSLTYSFKNFEQVQGRIDRINTKYSNLYYYIFVSNSFIDLKISESLKNKKDFNERKCALESGFGGLVK